MQRNFDVNLVLTDQCFLDVSPTLFHYHLTQPKVNLDATPSAGCRHSFRMVPI